MAYSSSPPSRSPRLHSLDALRGLDMLIILGLDALVLLLASRNPESAFLQEAARQMTHARWEGLHLYDLVFPVFVFISGVSMSFSPWGNTPAGTLPPSPGFSISGNGLSSWLFWGYWSMERLPGRKACVMPPFWD